MVVGRHNHKMKLLAVEAIISVAADEEERAIPGKLEC